MAIRYLLTLKRERLSKCSSFRLFIISWSPQPSQWSSTCPSPVHHHLSGTGDPKTGDSTPDPVSQTPDRRE